MPEVEVVDYDPAEEVLPEGEVTEARAIHQMAEPTADDPEIMGPTAEAPSDHEEPRCDYCNGFTHRWRCRDCGTTLCEACRRNGIPCDCD